MPGFFVGVVYKIKPPIWWAVFTFCRDLIIF